MVALSVDSDNTGRMPEGQAPSTVNNGVRALEGIIARWEKDINGALTSSGASNAYVATINRTLTPAAYYDGLVVAFDAFFENTASATLNVNGVGAVTIKKEFDQNLIAGDIRSGQKVVVVYDGTNWQMISPVGRRANFQETVINTTSGTSHAFDVPTSVWKITGGFRNVSTNGSSPLVIQVGDSSTWKTSTYVGTTSQLTTSVTTSAMSSSVGFKLTNSIPTAASIQGIFTLMRTDAGRWAFAANISRTDVSTTFVSAGSADNTTNITRIRLTTVNGTDLFTVGKFQIMLE